VALKREEILSRIEKLQVLMSLTHDTFVNEYEMIAVEKVKGQFTVGPDWPTGSGKYMSWLNQTYKDYKHRKTLDIALAKESFEYRKFDILFSEDEYDEMLYKSRYEHLFGVPGLHSSLDKCVNKIKDIKKHLSDDLLITFTTDDITRIRISKKPGDLVMVENLFDNNSEFEAVIDRSETECSGDLEKEEIQYRTTISWHKQNDKTVYGESTITEYDIEANNVLYASDIKLN